MAGVGDMIALILGKAAMLGWGYVLGGIIAIAVIWAGALALTKREPPKNSN